ncbi:ABC transporter ATP-binding protein [Fictibacillus sp. BK138]|jgi:ABC-2 type transport system ATP-binding protein|uniref:ABC transporter ATP-binding protein n=1 Tax=Fictibacillus sp. BK138 TaxID=2512121 RepID=UPI0010291A13|nr:ABC transporter ATP-binding protein [Fictibacillus sp. BK138]RZT16506.1 ABC-2 type transport system ATP-binding protein [Fictibacillus sp. BK138]
MKVVECKELTKRYGKAKAINNLSFELTENKITGLIGRNGAGKTTLLKMIAGYLHHTSGDIQVFSENPFNNLKVSANSIFIDNGMSFSPSLTLEELLETSGEFYPNWDQRLAKRLFDYFSFNPLQSHVNLSKGMKSTFNMIIGLAARCPLTIFDEPTSGMDAGTRKDFYRALLKDYIAHPRTIILSSHLLSEVEDILEEILLIKNGEKLLHMPIEILKEYSIGISGKATAVSEWTSNKETIFTQSIGVDGSYVVIKNDCSLRDLEIARDIGLEVSSVSAEDVCTYLTSKTKEGIDHVFN